MKKLVSSGSPFENSIGFSRACRIGNQIAVAGTAPIQGGKTAFVGDLYNQTKCCLEVSVHAIEEAGGCVEDVIRTRIMLIDIGRWEEAAKAHGEFFSDIKPACTFVEVKGLIDPEWLVEIEVDCVLSKV